MVEPLNTGLSGHETNNGNTTGKVIKWGNNYPILPTETQFIMIYYIARGKLAQGTQHKDSHSSGHDISFSKLLG